MRQYTSAYVPMQNNASALSDLGALSWLAEMPALVCAGLESSTCFNLDGDSPRMRAYELGATGDRSINNCADSRRMEYKPGFMVQIACRRNMTNAWIQQMLNLGCIIQSQRAHDVIVTSLWRRNDVTTSFWHHNDAIIASCARWDVLLQSWFALSTGRQQL